MLIFADRGFHAQIIVAAEIDLVIGRGLLVFTGVDILVIAGQVVVLLDQLGLGLLERQRLLGLQNRLRLPMRTAIDARDGIVLAEIVKTSGAFRARTLRAPFRLDHMP